VAQWQTEQTDKWTRRSCDVTARVLDAATVQIKRRQRRQVTISIFKTATTGQKQTNYWLKVAIERLLPLIGVEINSALNNHQMALQVVILQCANQHSLSLRLLM